jgi:predicted nucleic-acid-binding protein
MITLDTSALIRYLVKDDLAKSDKVRELLKSGQKLQVPDVVILEINFILIKKYSSTKQAVCEGIEFIFSLANVKASDEIKKAAKIYKTNSLSLADCLIIAGLEANSQLASFDKKLLKLSGVKSAL